MDPSEKTRLRIGIVGAGPAGIVCARELKKRGWTDVTLLEAQVEAGGRTRTASVFDEKTGRHEVIEIGTHYILRGPVLRELIDDAGLAADLIEYPSARYRKLSCSPISPPYHPFLPPDARTPLAQNAVEMARYLREVHRHRFLDRPGFEGLPGRGLSSSIDEWLTEKRFVFLRGAMLPLINILCSGNGYHRVPSAYLMKLEAMRLRLPLWRNLALVVPRLRAGNQEIWRRCARSLNVHYEHPVRQLVLEGGRAQVRARDTEFVFDRLIWTGTLPHLASLLAKQPDGDRLLTGARSSYEKVQYLRRVVTAYRIEGLPRNILWLFPEYSLARVGGVAHSMLNYTNSDIYAFHAWLDEAHGLDSVDAEIRGLVTRLGGRVVERMVEPFMWHYHPFFEAPQIEAGVYDAIEREQGRDGVYVCGETLSGITLPAVTEYAKRLVERFF